MATPRLVPRFSIATFSADHHKHPSNSVLSGLQLGDTAMIDFSLHPYMRWLRGRLLDDRPDFNADRDDLSPQTPTQRPVDSPTPESEALFPSTPSIGLTGFAIEPPNEVPGFRVAPRDDTPGFNLNKDDVSRPETTWPEGAETPAPESPEIAQASSLPPGVDEPDQPAPTQLPELLRYLQAIQLPQVSTAVDPQTGQRIVPYAPLINSARPYSTADEDARGIGVADPYTTRSSALPGPTPIEAHAIQQRASLAAPERLADINTQPAPTTAQSANAPRLFQEASWTSWPQPLQDGQTHVQRSDVDPGDPERAAEQQLPQQTPLPREQQTRLNNVPETAFGKDLTGIPPTSGTGTPPIERAVYNPHVDPGLDELFDLIGVGENRAQGNAARDAEVERIEKENPGLRYKKEVRIYIEGGPDYMMADILYRPNGTSEIIITEVKSGNGKLTPESIEGIGRGGSYGKNLHRQRGCGQKVQDSAARELRIPADNTTRVCRGRQSCRGRETVEKCGI